VRTRSGRETGLIGQRYANGLGQCASCAPKDYLADEGLFAGGQQTKTEFNISTK
jgi:hypothetical protein